MNKVLRIEMPDGSKWDVPVELIARNKAEYQKDYEEYGGDIEKCLQEGVIPLFDSDDSEIHDWAANNMNWEDVSKHATKVSEKSEVDFDEGWVNGDSEVLAL